MRKPTDTTLLWSVECILYKCQILPQTCVKCKEEGTLVGMPKPLREKQPDKTNVVCFPGLGGCNFGFHLSGVDEETLSCVWDKDL